MCKYNYRDSANKSYTFNENFAKMKVHSESSLAMMKPHSVALSVLIKSRSYGDSVHRECSQKKELTRVK